MKLSFILLAGLCAIASVRGKPAPEKYKTGVSANEPLSNDLFSQLFGLTGGSGLNGLTSGSGLNGLTSFTDILGKGGDSQKSLGGLGGLGGLGNLGVLNGLGLGNLGELGGLGGLSGLGGNFGGLTGLGGLNFGYPLGGSKEKTNVPLGGLLNTPSKLMQSQGQTSGGLTQSLGTPMNAVQSQYKNMMKTVQGAIPSTRIV